MRDRKEQILLRVPAEEKSLMVVRMTAAGVLAGHGLDIETLEDIKTAVYEACYALLHQKMRPENLEIGFSMEHGFYAEIRCLGQRRETSEHLPDARLCRCVLETIVPGVEVLMERNDMTAIRMWSTESAASAFGG